VAAAVGRVRGTATLCASALRVPLSKLGAELGSVSGALAVAALLLQEVRADDDSVRSGLVLDEVAGVDALRLSGRLAHGAELSLCRLGLGARLTHKLGTELGSVSGALAVAALLLQEVRADDDSVRSGLVLDEVAGVDALRLSGRFANGAELSRHSM